MSKPKQWKQGRELKRYDIYSARERDRQESLKPEYWGATFGSERAYPQEAEPDGRLWVGSGDSQ